MKTLLLFLLVPSMAMAVSLTNKKDKALLVEVFGEKLVDIATDKGAFAEAFKQTAPLEQLPNGGKEILKKIEDHSAKISTKTNKLITSLSEQELQKIKSNMDKPVFKKLSNSEDKMKDFGQITSYAQSFELNKIPAERKKLVKNLVENSQFQNGFKQMEKILRMSMNNMPGQEAGAKGFQAQMQKMIDALPFYTFAHLSDKELKELTNIFQEKEMKKFMEINGIFMDSIQEMMQGFYSQLPK